MIPVVKTYRKNPVYLQNLLSDEYCGGKAETFNQKVNVIENENSFVIDLIAPGYDRNEIKVTVDKNELTIASVKNEEKETEKMNYLRQEFHKTPFSRTFELPKNVEADHIGASHKNGVLRITVPKRAKIEIEVKEIEVK